MRFVYASTFDARTMSAGARSGHLIPRAIEHQGHEVLYVGPLEAPRRFLDRCTGRVCRGFDRGLLLPEREPARLRRIGRMVDRAVASAETIGPIDAVLSFGTLAIARSCWEGPAVVWSDCTLRVMIDYFPGFTGLSRRARRHAEDAEAKGLRRASVVAFPTPWAAESAVRDYGCDRAKVHVLPFGPGLEVGTDRLATSLADTDGRVWRLLWIGSEWERKGGAAAVEAAVELKRRGRKVELTMIGAQPPSGSTPSCVHALGGLDRGTAAQEDLLASIYRRSHALFLPTMADCAPIAIRDAMAMGLATISTRTGGIPWMVEDGVDGRLVEPGCGPAMLADAVESLLGDPTVHARACAAARARHDREWNWRASIDRLVRLVAESHGRVCVANP